MYERSLNEHGFPSWIAQDADQKFAPDEYTDHAAAAYEANQEAVRKAGNTSSPGSRIVVKHMGSRSVAGPATPPQVLGSKPPGQADQGGDEPDAQQGEGEHVTASGEGVEHANANEGNAAD